MASYELFLRQHAAQSARDHVHRLLGDELRKPVLVAADSAQRVDHLALLTVAGVPSGTAPMEEHRDVPCQQPYVGCRERERLVTDQV
jgi:hypothetical protein